MQNPGGSGQDNRFTMGFNTLSGGGHDIYGGSHSSVSTHGLLGMKRSAEEAGFDPEKELQGVSVSSDDDSNTGDMSTSHVKKTSPANGKKTKGRVKIKMEFIDNKLRRYTTFSKRKTGIMKKAYELSTLTGTQVMLLVASETGHVYTFATRKLQPMITSEAGKALIQTCLNSPDPSHSNVCTSDQRMSATGFEETELTYNINEEEQKDSESPKPVYSELQTNGTGSPSHLPATTTLAATTLATLLKAIPTTATQAKAGGVAMQLPAAGLPTILAQDFVSAGSSPPNLSSLQLSGEARATLTASLHNAADRPTMGGDRGNVPTLRPPPLVRITGLTPVSSVQSPASSEPPANTVVAATQSLVPGSVMMAGASGTGTSIPGTVMYHTSQGVVYATPSGATLPEGVIFNLGQPSVQLPQSQEQGGNSSGNSQQQYITIPVPVSLSLPAQTNTTTILSSATDLTKNRK